MCKGNLGRDRLTMPQFPNDKVRDTFLEKMKKQGVRVTEGKMKVGHLRASQDEILATKAIGMAGSYLDGDFSEIKNAIVVSKDGYIVDGHHRWAALLMVDPSEEMNVIRIGVPIGPLLAMVNEHEGVEKRGLTDSSIGREKKEWFRLAANLLEKLPDAESQDAARAEFVGMLQEYGSPIVAEPRRSSAYSPKGGWRVPQTDRMADSRKKKKNSGRKQPFISPEDFTVTEARKEDAWLRSKAKRQEGRYMPVGELLELKKSPDDRYATAPARREWVMWLAKLKREAESASNADWSRSEFTKSKAGRRLEKVLKDFCGGKVTLPENREHFGSLFELIAPGRGGKANKFAYTAQPMGPGHGVGISPSAAPADREAGRHQYVVDGPTIRKSKPGYKPVRAGAGSMVPTRAKGS